MASIALDAAGNGSQVVGFDRQQVSSVTVVFANTSTAMRDCGKVIDFDGPLYSCAGRGVLDAQPFPCGRACSSSRVGADPALGNVATSRDVPRRTVDVDDLEETPRADPERLHRPTITGEEQPLESYAGKVALVVNTASKCGFTPQFEGLEKLHQEYADQGLVVLGFPCNQFGSQDPGSNEEIGAFCERNYGVSFPMFEKIDVNGDDAHPLYQWLREEKGGILGDKIKWNFTKFLVGTRRHRDQALRLDHDAGEDRLRHREGPRGLSLVGPARTCSEPRGTAR